MDSDSDASEGYVPAKAKAAATKPAAKAQAAAASKPRSALGPATNSGGGGNGKTIEDIYQKKTQLEHILLRPDTYIGSTEKQQQQLWVHDGERMVLASVSVAPGLYKIFDEILVNAADNKARDPRMDTLRVDIDPAANRITVFNNGDGVPVEVHKEEGVYVPELIFGHLLTSSNYNDDEKKVRPRLAGVCAGSEVTGGRNGYGAKLANIFSTEFVIETCDGRRKRAYRQVFSANMTAKGEPQISPCKASDNWTRVTFSPDLSKFGMAELEADTVALMRKRVYDMAGILGKGVKVVLNGQALPIKSFHEYCELYLGDKLTGGPREYLRVNERWEVCVAPTDGQFQQISFANAICTTKGGTHVNYVTDQVTKFIAEMILKKNKKSNVKPFMVKNHVSVFVNALIENPAFDSQTKDTLTLRASAFGSKCELPEKFLKKVADAGVLEAVAQFAKYKEDRALKKSDGAKRNRLTGIPKLDDANDAGTKASEDCTLILTEGDSAKALAVAGLSVVGRNRYGVFPLRGKLLNVRDASASQITNNAEISNIKQIMGLQYGKDYSDVKQLRYGHLMIMTDQDHDGSHIKGLIMNFLHHFYPSLLKVPGFLVEFITPIIKARKGRQTMVFHTMPEYEEWKESLGAGGTKGWDVKYYKGLGTSTNDEAREYFANISNNRKEFIWTGVEDGEAIQMAFSKKMVEDRKAWLSAFVPGTFLDQRAPRIPYRDFIHKELILFSRADLERSIPSMVDGFKPGQRKIMFSCFKRNLKKDIKVAQLAGYVSEHSAYHHGEASLSSTIVGLAQNFVGSNNVNLLYPSGQFGTRLQGGKDASSPRYIFTRLAAPTRHLFNEADDPLLHYLNEEGQDIEPLWYMPILPMVLINGAEGIGTGWSTSIPNYNPRDVVANLKRYLAGEALEPMQPWYKGFTGTIHEVDSKTSGKSYAINGCVAQIDTATLEVTELPVKKWTQDYKEYLETLIKPESKEEAPLVVDYKDFSGDGVHFQIQLVPDRVPDLLAAGAHAKLKLVTRISTGNMMLFDAEGRIRRFSSPEEVIDAFAPLRLEFYHKRKAHLLQAAELELKRLSNRTRFILAVVAGQLQISGRKKAAVEEQLEAEGYDRMAPNRRKKATAAGAPPEEREDDDAEGEAAAASASYDYLLSMPIHSLTHEKVAALQEDAAAQERQVAALARRDPRDLWAADLDAFLAALDAEEAAEAGRREELVRQQKQSRGGGGVGAKGKAKKKTRCSDEDSGDDSDFETQRKKKKAPAKKGAPAEQGPAAPNPNFARLDIEVAVPALSDVSSKPKRGKKAQQAAAAAPGADGGALDSIPEADGAAAPCIGAAKPAKPAISDDTLGDGLSLMDRLAGRLGGMKVASASNAEDKPAVGAAKAAAAAAKPPAKPAVSRGSRGKARKPIYVDSDSEEEEDVPESESESDGEDEVSSPAQAPPKAKPAAKNLLAKAAAGAAAASKAAAPKRKPASKAAAPAVADAADAAEYGDQFTFTETEASPIAKPQGKVRRIRSSPFHKGSGDSAPAATKPAAAKKAKKKADSSEEEASDGSAEESAGESEVAPRARAAPRAAAARKPVIVDLSSEEEDEASAAEEDSDFEGDSD